VITRTRILAVFLGLLGTLLLMAAPALADGGDQSTMNQGYSHGHTTLPFTGMDLGLITAGAIVLLAFGVGLRRFGRSKA
jgi:hypothetical protein